MISDPFFRAIAIAVAIIVAFFVSVALGLVVARSTSAPKTLRRLIAQGTALAVFVVLLAIGWSMARV